MSLRSKVLKDLKQKIGLFHVIHVKLQKVPPSEVRPDGFKLNCALIDLRVGKAVLILDNHAPFGYHIHPKALEDHTMRQEIQVSDPFEAISIFEAKVKEMIVSDEGIFQNEER